MALNKTGKLFGTNTGEDPGLFPQNTRPELRGGVANTGQQMHSNISLQAGEEFAVNFGHDGIAARRVPVSPDIPRNHENRVGLNRESGPVRYEDLTNILGLRRMDSECASDISDFVSIKQPAQEMENWASVNILSKIQKGDGDSCHALRKAVRESIGDQPGIGPAVSPLLRYESSQTNGFSGSGILDDSVSGKMKFLCSFGGKILPRPSDGKLRYVGGETHIISIRKDISWEELVKKTLGVCIQHHTIKYQLPGEDLDALISVSSDEDLQNMIEEYHGLERHEGSQKLRIFLVPLGESEETSSTEVSTVQQSDPDYQYVVAVNGIVDPSPRKNIGGQGLTNETSQSVASLNFASVFQKTSPNASSPLEIRDGINALNPDGILNDSLNVQRSFPISSTPIQVAGSGTGYVQLLDNNSCQGSLESNTSYITAQLHPENSSINTADCRYPYQHKHGVVGQPMKLNERRFDNYNPEKELLTPVYVNPSDGYCDEIFGGGPLNKERRFYSGNPLSCLDDPICQHAESYETTDSPHGMPHAFSDSQLHETGARSGYTSQEGIGQSFSWNLKKAQLPSTLLSSVSQVNLMEHQHDSILCHPQMECKIPKVESAEMRRWQDVASSSPYSESLGMNDPFHKDSILTEKKYLIAQTDLRGSTFVAKDIKESSVNLERMKIIEERNPIPKKDSKIYEGKSSIMDMGHGTELHLLDSFPANNLNANINMQKNWVLPSKDIVPPSSGMMGLSLKNLADKNPSDLLGLSQRTNVGKKCTLAEGLNGEQGIDFSVTRNFDLNAPILKCEENSFDKSSLGGHTFELSIDPDYLESAQIQPSSNLMATGFLENPIVSSAILYPPVIHDNLGPSLNFPMNGLDNPSKNISFKKAPFLDDLTASTDQMVDQFIHEHSASGKSKVEDIMSGQSKNLERCNDVNPVEPFFIVEDVTGVVPKHIESSLVGTSHIVDEVGSDVVSPSPTEAESIIPESDEPEDFKDDQTDKSDFLSDAMIAEMEASIYGLQIIRNADLEELTELGSGTYGTVFHGKWRGTDVAIKRIKKSCFAGRASEQERLAKDFWREAHILSNLHHPNVVAFYGIVPDGAGGTLATVTEYMVNGSLRHVLVKKDRLLDRRKKLIIAMDAAFGMEYLHSKNIVHFDLKCDNLLVNLRDPQRPICKVGDFGLSRIKRNTLVSGGVRGTLPWMAPELLNGSSNRVSEKVDVFSFGISMWELLTGEEPYADMHCGAIIGGIVKNTLRPPVPERCDPEWRKLMEECWSPDPERRPSFTEITDRLRSMSMALQTKGNYQAWKLSPNSAS
ncbi:uncharacterized protein LOC133314701 [Gastrolobium bilobum]|uniref:uncharacterized protein LOC133314701 n=1 Tax=Gastrolobium bilobum TaxID=150636 RepID=UPI002AB25F31|nr:uncharacterized protein LOC133314701 [Gastrolobium bilobum]